MLQTIAGFDPLDPSTVPVPVAHYSASLGQDLNGLRMGVPTNYYFDLADPEVESAVRRAITALEELGAEIREVALPSMQYAGALRIAAMADSVVTHEPYLEKGREDYGPTVLYRTLAGQFVMGRDYSKALKVQRIIKQEYVRVLQDVDFLVTPSSPVAAWRIDAETVTIDGVEYPTRGLGSGMTSRCTSPSNATGLPAMSIPCGFTQSGLPIGLQLIGRAFEEPLLYQVAYAYEKVSPARERRPAIVDAV
jgi:aspartyl-tRNA(Asn)/glutamyl-tRNA(Gln) amidotransferase subunit A